MIDDDELKHLLSLASQPKGKDEPEEALSSEQQWCLEIGIEQGEDAFPFILLFNHYKSWTANNDLAPLSQTDFGRFLSQRLEKTTVNRRSHYLLNESLLKVSRDDMKITIGIRLYETKATRKAPPKE